MKARLKKLMAAALTLCLMLAMLPAGVLADGPYTVTFYKADETEAANGVYEKGTITAKSEDGEAGPFAAGTKVVLSVTTDLLYLLSSCRVEEADTGDEVSTSLSVEKGNISFTMPEGDVKVIAEFTIGQSTVVLAKTDLEHGDFNWVGSIKGVGYSQLVILDNTPDPGYGLDYYKITDSTGDVLQTRDNVFDTYGEDCTIIAKFRLVYDITTAQSDYGTISVDVQQAGENDTVNVTVTPIEGYVDSKVYCTYTKEGETVTEQLTGGSGSYTFVMPAYNVTIYAEYEPTYTVNTSAGNYGGIVTASKDSGFIRGEQAAVTIQPYYGYDLLTLTVDGEDVTDQVTWDGNGSSGRTGTYSFLMPSNDVNVVATFDRLFDSEIYRIYDSRYGYVSINVWSEALDKFVPYTLGANEGDLIQVVVAPSSGYVVNGLSIKERDSLGSSVDYWRSWGESITYCFYMPDSGVDIHVDFTEAAPEHIVYVDKAANGSLKADTTWAADGQIVYVTATPDTGYVLSSLFVKTAKGDQLKVYEAKKAGVYYFYMPDQYVTVSAYFAPAASALPFNDVAYTSWYYDAVKFVYDKGIMDGVSYYRFAPDATITRGMVVTMLWRMAGEPYEAAAGFTDVAAGRYYTTAVAWAARNGIVEGMTATTFAPDQAITREQLASILYRYAKWLGFSGYGSDISGYTDAGKVSSYAYDAMSWAVRSGVVTGTSARVLDPQGTASRAAAAQMFMNFYNYIK